MTTAPFTSQIRPRPGAAPQPSPLGVVMLIPAEAGVTPAVNTLTEITDANVAAQLGPAANLGRRWWTHIESKSNVHIGVIPFDDSDPEANAPPALAALQDSAQRANLSFAPDIVLAPHFPGQLTGASAIATALETVCQDASVLCRAITDAYNPPGSAHGTQAQVLVWAGNNTGPNILAMANDAPAPTVVEYGSVIACAHICQQSALHGVGSHPFNLSTPVTGVGTPEPVRVFDITDGSAEAEALADAYVSSLILYDGQEYIWNGKLNQATVGDPRQYWGNAVISDRMVKQARRTLAPYYGQRATSGVFASMADHVRLDLVPAFVTPGLVDEIIVFEPYLSGTTAVVEFEVGFHGFIESIRLVADIFIEPDA